MRAYITDFLAEYDYPAQARAVLLSAYDAVRSSPGFLFLLEEYEHSFRLDYKAALERMKDISASSGIHEYTGALLLLICWSRRLEEYYKAEGLSPEIYKTSMFDLKYKLMECKCVKNIWGSFAASWQTGFFSMTLLGFHKLQFEIHELETQYEKDGLILAPGSQVIKVHIPRTGGRLDEESRKTSYAMAAEFFSARYNLDPVVFYCSSWLLFPKHKEIMKEGSNLLSFIRDYDIFKAGEYENYDHIWRLFDMDYTEDHAKLPADTSLRREYIKMMDNGEKLGWGKGIYLYKG